MLSLSKYQYRTLPFGFLQCLGRPKPPCHLLILLGVAPVPLFGKGLAPSGKIHPPISSFIPENLYFRSFSRAYNECALLMQGAHKNYMSIGVSVRTIKFAARNSGIGVRQESNPQSPTAYSSVRYVQCFENKYIYKITK
jgi:hypothetical protein